MADQNRKMDRKGVFEPYDMDTGIGTNNSGVLMFSPYLEDIDTVSSVISGGDSGGSNAPVYNAQDSVLWNNVRDAFRGELVQMYRTLRTNGSWNYDAIEKRFEDHQAYWPEAIFNEDAWVKYITPLIDPVTVDDDTGELIKTDRYLTMLQGSKQEQRKWWLYNRLRYLDSKYDTGNASANIINIRFFNSGTLTLKTAVPLYAAVSFGGGTTPDMKRVEANTPVSFTYTAESGVTEMETWIHSANLITDVGDLSVFYPNECDFSKATLLRRLKIGDATTGYSNANLTTIDVRNSPLLEYIDCRNCPRLAITVNLENSPRLVEAYFDGTTVTGVDLADGCVIETLHLPSTVTSLTLLNLNKLSEFVIPDCSNISRLMLASIDSEVVDPIDILQEIQPHSQVNIQGLYLELDDAEAISDFFDLLDTMSGVTREKNANGEWIYHDEVKAVVSGEIHTNALTGNQIATFSQRYPYIRVTADHTTSYLYYYNYDGSTLLYTETIIDGGNGAYAGTPTRADDEHNRYTFAGWSTQQDSAVADPNATVAIVADRSVYAAYTRTSIAQLKYYTYDGGTLLNTETIIGGGNGTYSGQPERAADARYTYTFAGWSTVPNGNAEANALSNVSTDRDVYAAYTAVGQKYTVRFYNGTTLLQTVNNVLYGGTANYTGTTPVHPTDPENNEFIGWSPSNTNIQGNTDCYAAWLFTGIITRRIIDRTISGSYENSAVSYVGSYAFYNCAKLTGVSFQNATNIGRYAFGSCAWISDAFFPNVVSIETSAFTYNYSLITASFPKAKNVGQYAFHNCRNLSNIDFPLLKTIGAYAFQNCSKITKASFPNVTSVETGAFQNCSKLTSVSMPNLLSVAENQFYSCNVIREVSFPVATTIGKSAFCYCSSLLTVSIPEATDIGSSAFMSCSTLASVHFSKATAVGAFAFAYCRQMSSFYAPLVHTIGFSAFLSCSTISSLFFPELKSAGQFAFCNCSSLETIEIGTNQSTVCSLANSNAFQGTNSATIYVPDSLVTSYQTATNWAVYSSRIKGVSQMV